MNNRKSRIRRWVFRCFAIILLLSGTFVTAWDFYETNRQNKADRESSADSCALLVTYFLNRFDVDTVYDSAKMASYMRRRTLMRNVCQSQDMEYLYVIKIDPQTHYRHYIFCVSSDDKKDLVMQRERPFGAISTEPLDSAELAIINGSMERHQTVYKNQFGHVINWAVPYLNEEGEMKALIGIEYNVSKALEMTMRKSLSDIIPMITSVILGMIVLLFLIRKRITEPLAQISAGMIEFAKNAGNKPKSLSFHSNDEIGEIAASFDKMVNDISKYMENIEQLTKERLENQVQLEVSRHIQYGLVPEKTEFNNRLFSISAITSPAKEVGGDFYDCFQLTDGTMCIMIGDVSGKGISAAIFMAMTKTMLREKLMSGISPAQALNQANNELCAQNPENLFVTVFVAVLDPTSGKIRYANAGHTTPVILQDKPHFLQMDSGIALGMFENAGLKDETLQLDANQGILLYTDGVTEALDKDNHFFGTQRLLDTVTLNCAETDNAIDTVNGVLNVVRDFSAGKEQFDDTAILAAYFKALSAKKIEIPLSVDVSSINIIKETVFETLGQNPQSRKVILACDEVLANIANHSGADQLTFGCEKKDSSFFVHFTDNGTPFDPTAEQPQDKDFDMLDMGGMGLNMIRQTAKSMTYIRENNLNVLTLEF